MGAQGQRLEPVSARRGAEGARHHGKGPRVTTAEAALQSLGLMGNVTTREPRNRGARPPHSKEAVASLETWHLAHSDCRCH